MKYLFIWKLNFEYSHELIFNYTPNKYKILLFLSVANYFTKSCCLVQSDVRICELVYSLPLDKYCCKRFDKIAGNMLINRNSEQNVFTVGPNSF